MVNESIFDFLKSDDKFQGVYRKCIELEKGINNELYDSLRTTARQICERLFQIIIIDYEKDEYLEDLCYIKDKNKKNLTLFEIIDECYDLGYIGLDIKDKYHKLRIYGNGGSHYNEDELSFNEMKKIHQYIFEVIKDCFSRFHEVDTIKYEFKLNSNLFTISELENILNNIPNEISTSLIYDEINNKHILLPKTVFEIMVKPYNKDIIHVEEYANFLDNNEYISSDNLNEILDTFDESVKHELSDMTFKSNKIFMNKLNSFKDVVNLNEIRAVIDNTSNVLNKEFLKFIDLIASNLIKSFLIRICGEVSNLKIIDDDKVIDAPLYEVVETDDTLEIKEVEKIIGIPDNCPKCNATLKKGSTKCPNCSYDLFEELNKRCPNCGKRVPLGSKFCIRCGYDLEKWKCTKCGYENKKDTKFCIKCGNIL